MKMVKKKKKDRHDKADTATVQSPLVSHSDSPALAVNFAEHSAQRVTESDPDLWVELLDQLE